MSFPPDHPGRKISAGLAFVPGMRALSSFLGPRHAVAQVVKRQSLNMLCRNILSPPPQPQDTAWSPMMSDTAGHAEHWPSVGTSTKFVHIGDRLEQNWTNLNVQSLNVVQIIDKYLANVEKILGKYFSHIWQIFRKYWTNIRNILGKYGQILCKQLSNSSQILGK